MSNESEMLNINALKRKEKQQNWMDKDVKPLDKPVKIPPIRSWWCPYCNLAMTLYVDYVRGNDLNIKHVCKCGYEYSRWVVPLQYKAVYGVEFDPDSMSIIYE